MTGLRTEDLVIRVRPGDARSTENAGVEYARALAGIPTDAFLEALAEHGGLIRLWAEDAGFGAYLAQCAAREFREAAEAEWQRIADAGRSGAWGRA